MTETEIGSMKDIEIRECFQKHAHAHVTAGLVMLNMLRDLVSLSPHECAVALDAYKSGIENFTSEHRGAARELVALLHQHAEKFQPFQHLHGEYANLAREFVDGAVEQFAPAATKSTPPPRSMTDEEYATEWTATQARLRTALQDAIALIDGGTLISALLVTMTEDNVSKHMILKVENGPASDVEELRSELHEYVHEALEGAVDPRCAEQPS